jgi:hypothetical protein
MPRLALDIAIKSTDVSPGQMTFLSTSATVDLEATIAVLAYLGIEEKVSRQAARRTIPGTNQGAYDSAAERLRARDGRRAGKLVDASILRATGRLGSGSTGFWFRSRRWSWRATAGLSSTGSTTILSDPPGARLFVDDAEAGETPVTVDLEKRTHRIRLEKDGFEPTTEYISVQTRDGPWILFFIAQLTLSGQYDSKYEFAESCYVLLTAP